MASFKRTQDLPQLLQINHSWLYDHASYHHVHLQEKIDLANVLSLKVVEALQIMLQTAKSVLHSAHRAMSNLTS